MKILIVDDNINNLYLLDVLFKGAGYDIVSAKNGIEALEKLRTEPFDGIVSDILMPVMDGFRLIRECKKDPVLQQIPFIFYTATYTEKKDEEFGLSLGAIRYIIKPAEPEDLLRQIRDGFSDHARALRDHVLKPVADDETFSREYAQRVGAKLEKKEQALQESEKKYRLLFERARDCILLISAEGEQQGKIIDANTAAAEMHGYTVEEMLTKNIADLDAPSSAISVREQFRRMQNGEWFKGESMHIRKDGTVFPIEINAGLIEIGTKKYILTIDRDITERKKAEYALQQVTKKLSLLNSITFNDIQNSVFSLNGYLVLDRNPESDDPIRRYQIQEEELIQKISKALNFAKNYQDLGIHPPVWQNVNQAFLMGISHLDFSSVQRTVNVDNLEIFADSLLERVFFTLADNILYHAKNATQVSIGYQLTRDNLILYFEDNGNGIPEIIKEKIFDRGFGAQKGMELFLVREILSITGISIKETGIPGKGARFELWVPEGAFRFPDKK